MSDPPSENVPNEFMQRISIPDIANKLSGDLKIEDFDTKKHRLEQEAYDACHRRWRLNLVLLMTIISLCFVFYLCFLTLNDATASVNDKRWATVFVSSIVTGSIGFLTGKAVS